MANPSVYRNLIGRLLYLSLTWLDLSYGVQQLSQFVSSPTNVHYRAALHLLKYLQSTVAFGLFYPVQQNLSLTVFSDADWASCLHTGLSLSGFCIFLGHSLVS